MSYHTSKTFCIKHVLQVSFLAVTVLGSATPARSFPPPQSLRLPYELLAHFPGVDGHLRARAGHAGTHAAVGLVELGFRRVAGLAPFLIAGFQRLPGRVRGGPRVFLLDEPSPD